MRVISGIYGSRPIQAPEGKNTRPTMDKVKGAMFNIIGTQIIDATVLDLFSGSGSLGIEALSRGAKKVYFNDKDYKAHKVIQSNLDYLKVEKDKYQLTNIDYKTLLNNLHEQIDVVLLDPPYKNKIYQEIILKLVESKNLAENPTIICEADLDLKEFEVAGFTAKEYKYGNKKLIVYKKLD